VSAADPSPRRPAGDETPDFEALGMLDGLEGAARESRAKLLEWLHADGCSVEELTVAAADGRLALLPAELALGAIGGMTPAEVAAKAGVELEALEAVRRAAGLPLPPHDVAELGELDLFGARALAAFIEGGLPLDGLIEASRVFGEAAAHAAAAAGTLANAAIPQEGDTEYDYAHRLGIATRELTPYAAELLGVMYMLHNRENIRQEIVAADELMEGRRRDVHEVTVGFCDVVGFTRLGEGVPAADLGAIATRLAALAADVTEPPVRLIKTIGDAVMFVGPEPAPLLDTVLRLMEAGDREGEQFPSLHAGAAHGQALRRWGDYYGGPVNRAARLTERARPSALIADEPVRERAGDEEFAWSDAGLKKLKGISEPMRVWRCRRAPVA
jgi:adenylate cyclase